MSVIPVNAAVVKDNTIVKAEVLTAGKAVKMKAIPNGKYILSEGENGVAPENITLKRVGKNLHVTLEGSDIEHPELIIEGFYDTQGELVGKGEDGQWHEYIATSGEEKDDAAFLMDGEVSPVALNAAPYPHGASLDNLSFAAFALSPALIALGALAALAAATGLGMAIAKHKYDKDDNGNRSEGGAGEGGDASIIPNTIVVTDMLDRDGNSIAPGDNTNDNSPTIIGTGTPGNIVIIRDDGKDIGSTKIEDDGNWTWKPQPPLTDGEHDLEIIEDNGNGGTSPAKPGPTLIVDTVAPSKAVIGDVLNDAGESILAEGITNDSTPTFVGTVLKPEPGLKVEIFDDKGNKVGEGDVNEDGTWSVELTSPAADGDHQYTVIVVDKATNRGQPSEPVAITIDTRVPELPDGGIIGPGGALEGAWDDVEPNTGWIDPGSATNDDKPEFKGGGLEEGDTVVIKDKGEVIGTAIVGEDGSWSFTPEEPMGEGEHSIVIVVIAPGGGESKPSEELKFDVDTRIPELPEGGIVGPGGALEGAWDDIEPQTGWIDPAVPTNDDKPEFQGGGLEEGDTVVIKDNDEIIGTAIVGEDGRWSFTPETPLDEGDHSIVIVVVAPGGGESEPSDELKFVVDVTAPELPGDGSIGPDQPFEGAWDDVGDRTGWINEDGTTPNTDDARPDFKGAGLQDEAGGLVIIMDGDTPIGSAIIQDDGTWTWTPTTDLAPGDHSIAIKIRDKAGLESAETDRLDFTVVTGGAPAQANITGVFHDDGGSESLIQERADSNDKTPLVRGTGGAEGNIIYVYNGTPDSRELLGTAIVGTDGTWSFSVPAAADLQDGLVSIHVVQQDALNLNLSTPSGNWDFMLDTAEPDAPTLKLVNDIGTEIEIPAGGTTPDDTPILSGTSTENGGYVTIMDGTTPLGTALVGADGSWSFPVPALGNGPHAISVTQTDKAGNTGPATVHNVTVDTSAVAVRITHLEQDNAQTGSINSPGRTNDAAPVAHGVATPGQLVTVYVNNSPVGSVTADSVTGEWSLELNLTGGDVTYTVHAMVNGSATPSGSFDVTLDTQAPTGTLTGIVDNIESPDVSLVAGGHTRDTTPRLEGTVAEGNVTVSIYDATRGLLGTIVVAAGGAWNFTPPNPLNDGDYSLTVTFTDDVGNVSAPTPAWNITVDTTAPDAPVVVGIEDASGNTIGDITNNPRPIVVGTAEPSEEGSRVEIRDQDGNVVGTGIVDAGGDWRAEIAPALIDGNYELIAVIVDPASNETPMTGAPIELEVDTTAPDAPVVIGIEDTSGNPIGDVTNEPRPVVVGTAEPSEEGSRVEIRDQDGNVVGTGIVDAGGDWRAEIAPALIDGNYELIAVIIDPANNETPMTGAPIELEVDLTPPEAPEVIGIESADDSSIVMPFAVISHTTNNPSPVIVGTADSREVGARIEIRDENGILRGVGTVTAEGTWRAPISPALDDGSYELTAVLIDRGGNPTPMVDTISLTIDTFAPELPDDGSIGPGQAFEGAWDDVGDRQGWINADGRTPNTDDARPEFKGSGLTANAGEYVIIYNGSNVLGTTTVQPDGTWTWTPSSDLLNGSYAVSIAIRDAARNESPKTDTLNFNVVTGGAPAQANITGVFHDDGGSESLIQERADSNDKTPLVRGTGGAEGNIIYVYNGTPDSRELLGTAIVGTDGTWSFSVPASEDLQDGLVSIHVVQQDALNLNLSTPSGNWEFMLDTAEPDAPTLKLVNDIGTEIEIPAGGTTPDNTPILSGTSTESGGYVTIMDGATPLGTALVGLDGSWSFPVPALVNGPHAISVTQTDKAGNTGPATVHDVTVDTSAVAVSITHLEQDNAQTGNINSPGRTNDAAPVAHGVATPGQLVTVYVNNSPVGSVTADSRTGAWSLELNLTGGDVTYTVHAMVNGSATPSGNFDVTLDTQAPTGTLTGIVDNIESPDVSLVAGGHTRDTTPRLEGTVAEGNVTVSIWNGAPGVGPLLGTIIVAAGGSWNFTPLNPLIDGEYNLQVTFTDDVGNVSAPTPAWNITVDTTAPDAPVIGDVTDSGGEPIGPVTSEPQPIVTGTAEKEEAGGKVVIRDQDGNEYGSSVIDDDGNWQVIITPPLEDGKDYELVAVIVDKAGNETESETTIPVTVDLTAPVLPGDGSIGPGQAFEGAWDDVGDRTGWINEDGTTPNTDDARPDFKGAGLIDEAGNWVIIMDGANEIGSALIQDDGTWTWTPTTDMAAGDHSIAIKIRDQGGLESAESDRLDFTVVTGGAPAQANITGVYHDDGGSEVLIQERADSNDKTPLVRGTGGAEGNIIYVYNGTPDSRELLGTAIVGTDGTWSFSVPASEDLQDGLVSIHVVQQDALNLNLSTPSGNWEFMLDTAEPDAPTLKLVNDIGTEIEIPAGGTTPDNTPILSGTSTESGGYVTIMDGATPLGTALVGLDGSWSFPVPALVNGPHAISVTQTDKAGNTGLATVHNVTVDTSAVAVSITHLEQDNAQTGNINSPGRTNDAAPVAHGVATPGQLVTVYVNNSPVGSVTADSRTGAWSLELNLTGGDVTYTVHAMVNGSATPSGNFDVTLDTQAPTGTLTGIVDNIESPDVSLVAGGHTRDTTPRLEGTVAEGNVTVSIWNGAPGVGPLLGTIIVAAGGSWNFTPLNPLIDGEYNLQVTFTDDVGNVSAPTPAWNITVDTTAPDAPVIDSVVDGSGNPIGPVTGEREPVVTGRVDPAEAGGKIIIRDQDGNELGSTTVGDDGSWQVVVSPALEDGDYELVAVIVDKAGNETESAPIVVEISPLPVLPGDGSIGPGQPFEGAWDDVGGRTGWINEDGMTPHTDDARPEFKGAGLESQVGSLVVIMDNNTGLPIGSTQILAGGVWSWTPTADMATGPHSVSIKIRDSLGRESAESDALEFNVQPGSPSAPTITDVFNDDAGLVTIGNGSATNDDTPLVRGTGGTQGNTINVYNGAQLLGTATVGADGRWELSVPAGELRDGNISLRAEEVSALTGSVSRPSGDRNFTLDTTAPDAPSMFVLDDTIPGNSVSIPNGGTTPDNTPSLLGTSTETGGYVTITDGVRTLGTAQVQSNGNWTFQLPTLVNGSHNIIVTQTDQAGNTGPATTHNVIVDTSLVAPSAPTVTGVYNDDGTGEALIGSGTFSNDKTPMVRGTGGTVGNIIRVYDGDTLLGSTTVVTGGTWSFSVPAAANLRDGTIRINAKEVNAASGRESAASGNWEFNLDTLAPDAPVITRIENDSGAEISGSTTDRDPLFKGTANPAEVGATIELRDSTGQLLGTGTVAADGSWEVLVTPRLEVGEDYNIKAVIIDKAGNRTEMANGVDLHIDPAVSILPPVGGEGGAHLVSGSDAGLMHMHGLLENNKIYTTLGGINWITQSTGSPPVAYIGRWDAPNSSRWIEFSPGSKTEFHVVGKQIAIFDLVVPMTGESFISVFDANGNFIYRSQLPGGYQNKAISAPIGSTLGKIVLEVSEGTVGSLYIEDLKFMNSTAGTIVADTTLPDIKSGSELFNDSSITFNRGQWHELDSGLRIFSSAAGNVSTNGANFTLGSADTLTLDVGAAPSVHLHLRGGTSSYYSDYTIRVYDSNGVLMETRQFSKYDNVSKHDFTAPDGKVIGKLILSGVGTFTVDDIIWGESPGLNEMPPSDIPLPPNPAPGSELFEDFNKYPTATHYQGGNKVTIESNTYDAYHYSNGLVVLKSISNRLGNTVSTANLEIYARNNSDDSQILFTGGATKFQFQVMNSHFYNDPATASQFTKRDVKVYDTDGNLLTTLSTPELTNTYRNTMSYNAPEGKTIGKIVFNGVAALIDDISWTTPPAVSTFSQEQEESTLLLNDEMIHLANIAEEQEEIIGIAGIIDVLKIEGAEQIIDLTLLADKVQSVEVIDITGTGNNTLNISLGDILAQGETNLFINDDTVQFMVKGNEGDVVNLDDMLNGTDPGDWAKANGVVEVAGVRYEVYTHSTVNAELLVQEGVQTNLI